jgi:hypothetical protein
VKIEIENQGSFDPTLKVRRLPHATST